MTECFLSCLNHSIEITNTCFFLNRFPRRAVRFTLMDLSYVARQMPASLSNMELTKDSLASLFGCQNFHLKFQSPTSDFHKLKAGKFLKITTGKNCVKLVIKLVKLRKFPSVWTTKWIARNALTTGTITQMTLPTALEVTDRLAVHAINKARLMFLRNSLQLIR